MKKYLLLTLLASAFLFSACSSTQQTEWKEYRSIFGRSITGGGEVSNDDWQTFYTREILPVFPDGVTVTDGVGVWKNKSGVSSKERSKIVLIISPASKNIRHRLNIIRGKYRNQFKQESVLLLEQPVHAEF